MPTPPTDTTADPYTPATPVPLVWPGTPVRVYRMTGTPGSYTLTQLPNVRALSCTKREGADPGSAIFDYNWTYPSDDAPTTVEEAITTGGTPPEWTVAEGDRLVIKMQNPAGDWEAVFDGEVMKFKVSLSAAAEAVFMTAVGIAKRLWDTPIAGQIIRNANTPLTAGDTSDIETDVRCEFNPRGEPNAIPDDASYAGEIVGDVDQEYKTFLDPLVIRDPDIRTYWTLNEAARYLTWVNNPNQTYVTNIDGVALDDLLVSKVPNTGTAFDPTDSTTYTEKPIRCPDTPFTGKDWPSFLKDLIGDYGFAMGFDLSTSNTGELTGIPSTALNLYGVQDGTVKYIFMQSRGSTLDRTASNCTHAEIERDLTDVANVWNVEGELEEYEVSFILAPGFPMNAANAADPVAWSAYSKDNPNYTESYYDLYRLFIFDETGEGHYSPTTDTIINTVPSLDSILGAPFGGIPQYTHRRRPPIGDLITDASDGTNQKWNLSISTDYTGNAPGIWNGTGTWQTVNSGAQLCKDRIGIRLTCDDPNEWNIGKSDTSGAPYPDGVVRVVESLNLAGDTELFTLRLTCRIQGDQKMVGTAALRAASPIQRSITRTIDARDRYRTQTVCAYSLYNNTATNVDARDDTSTAAAEASAVQMMTEAGRLDGSFKLDHLTTYYNVGDRIAQIYGRNTPLRTDAGSSAENPIYPVVVERVLNFYPEQYTELTVTDAGANYTRYQRSQRHAAPHKLRRK